MNSRRLLTNSSLYFLGNVASRAVGFLMIPFYTRVLSPGDYGTIELIDLMITIVVITVGVSAAGASMIRIYHDEPADTQHKVVSTALICALTLGAVIVAAAAVFAEFGSTLVFHSDSYANLIRVSFVAMYLGSLAEICLLHQRIRERVMFFTMYSLAQLCSTAILNLFFLYVMRAGIWSFAWSKLIFGVAGGAVLVIAVVREVGLSWDLRIAKKMIRFGAPMILVGGGMFIIHSSDRFFLSRYVTVAEIGIYSLAYRFGFLVTYLVGEPFGRAWNPTVFGHVGKPDWKEMFARVSSYLTFALTLAALALALFRKEIITVATGPAFQTAAALIPILVASYCVREMGDFFRNVLLISKEKSKHLGVIVAISAAVNIGLNFALIPEYGAWGAAVATLLTFSFYLVVIWFMAQREHNLPLRTGAVFLTLATAVGLGFLDAAFPMPMLILAILWKLALLAGFVAAASMFGLIPRDSVRQAINAGAGAWSSAKGYLASR
jgi:O-antigen/teichoic acid export membrane protein